MKIVMTANAAWNVWNFRRPVISALQADGHQVCVLAPPDDAVTALETAGCTVIPLKMDVKGMNPARDLGLVFRYGRHFRSLRPDAVLGYTIKPNLYGAFAARRAGVPFLPNVTGLGTAFLSGGPLQRVAVGLYRGAFRGLPVVFFQNHDDRDLFLSQRIVGHDQVRVLPGSGIDFDRFPAAEMPAGDGLPVFLLIARLLRDKGVVEFVEAARLVNAAGAVARFRLLGALGAENRTAIPPETVAAWQAEGVVEYLGQTDDVRPFIAAATCVVLPSYREGAPRTLIEAAAMARPLIATDVPGCTAVVEHGTTGFLCAVRDAGALAGAIRQFLSLDPTARAQMGQAGRRKMEREFDQALVADAYRAALDLVTRGRGQAKCD